MPVMGRSPKRWWRSRLGVGLLGAAFLPSLMARADAWSDAQAQYRHGDYAGALAAAQTGIQGQDFSGDWPRLQAESLLALGRYAEARTALNAALTQAPESLRLRLLAVQAERFSGHADEVAGQLQAMDEIIRSRGQYDTDPQFLVDLGEASLLLGAEPKVVLEGIYQRAEQADPPVRDAFLAAGRLALEKHDYALASRTFAAGVKAFPDDPDLWWGLAASFRNDDRAKMLANAALALSLNPNHAPTELLLGESLIDAEDYAGARATLQKILTVNPTQPQALALLAVIEQLQNQPAPAAADRAKALATWPKNPEVDYLIGRKLAQNYRFVDAVAAQGRALQMDQNYEPARIQLAEDLLRLGRDDDGWALAAQAHQADPYDVEAYNLVNLHDQMGNFTTLESVHFDVLMAKNEAPVYGDLVVAELERAYTQLTAKYKADLNFRTAVEIYPNPDDFAVRTFGMPDIGGFLGVCFGPVMTVNSPATQAGNWQDVLWHEFTHVVTLTLTHNQTPRWLSEGFSVYEEGQASPAWGQKMTLDYHDRILDGKINPLSRMSAAFLEAKDLPDLLFAYYEAMLVVQSLNERYGFDRLLALLDALGNGQEINAALATEFGPLPELDAAFAQYARAQAKQFEHGVDFTRPAGDSPEALAKLGPDNFYVRMQRIRVAFGNEQWDQARAQLAALVATGLYIPGPENLHLLLARADAKLGDTAGEKAALTVVAEHEGDSLTAATRLLELAEAASDWPGVARWSQAWLAINPLAAQPWRSWLTASEHLGARDQAIAAGLALLQLDPPDAAAVHYRVARQLQHGNPSAARRQVLLALEEAPRYRDAYALLAALPKGGADTPPLPVLAVPLPSEPATPSPSSAMMSP